MPCLMQRLGALGWRVEIIPDETLGAETIQPTRIRKIMIDEDGLVGFAGAATMKNTTSRVTK